MKIRTVTTLASLVLLLSSPAAFPAAGAAPQQATFAGGCFWCMVPAFDGLDGVKSVVSGYTGGLRPNPTYAEVSSGKTGHAEAVEITYDPAVINYSRLLDVFWRNIDPTVKDRQFCDVGTQYRSAIFYHDEEQKRLAEASKRALEQSKRFPGPIYTEIAPAAAFYRAEEYHQDYYRKNPVRYKYYRFSCGRDRRLEELWAGPERVDGQRQTANCDGRKRGRPLRRGGLSRVLRLRVGRCTMGVRHYPRSVSTGPRPACGAGITAAGPRPGACGSRGSRRRAPRQTTGGTASTCPREAPPSAGRPSPRPAGGRRGRRGPGRAGTARAACAAGRRPRGTRR